MKKIILLTLVIIFGISLGIARADETSRHLIAVPKGSGKVFLGWRLLHTDPYNDDNFGFTIYRRQEGDSEYSCINGCNKITDSTNFIDRGLTNGTTYYYYVQSSDQSENSNVAKVTASTTNNYLAFQSSSLPGVGNLDGSGPSVGDLDGDGLMDYVILDVSNYESDPGNGTMRLKAIKSDGTMLWDFDTGYYLRFWEVPGKNNNPPWKESGGILVPFIVYDLNNDGNAEVIARTDNGPQEDNDIHLTYLSIITTVYSDGSYSAQEVSRIELPLPTNIAIYRESKIDDGVKIINLPHYLAIAHLDGIDNPPQIIAQEAVHDGERLNAFDVDITNNLQLSLRWDFQSTTGYSDSPPYDRDAYQGTGGSGTHEIPIYDMDGDGKDEVFDGSTLLDDDGSIIWTAYRNEDGKRIFHPDAISYGDLDPNNPGDEVWFVVEGSGTQGAYLVDAEGNTLWETIGWRHGHDGWAANLTDDLEGVELYGWNAKRNDNDDPRVVAARIYDTSGNLIYEETGYDDLDLNQNRYHSVIQWDADNEIEMYYFDNVNKVQGIQDVSYDSGSGQLQFSILKAPRNISPGYYTLRADVFGDFREEFLQIDKSRRYIKIYTNTDKISTRKVSRWENLEYQKTAARVGASYWRYFGPINFDEQRPPRVRKVELQGVLRP